MACMAGQLLALQVAATCWCFFSCMINHLSLSCSSDRPRTHHLLLHGLTVFHSTQHARSLCPATWARSQPSLRLTVVTQQTRSASWDLKVALHNTKPMQSLSGHLGEANLKELINFCLKYLAGAWGLPFFYTACIRLLVFFHLWHLF